MVGRDDDEYPDEVEERLVNEEYKVWKKNTPFLYGTFRVCGAVSELAKGGGIALGTLGRESGPASA